MKQLLLYISALLAFAPAMPAQKLIMRTDLPTAEHYPLRQQGAYVYADTVYYNQTINYRTLSFGTDSIAYEAFDMAGYPTNAAMKTHFWGLKYYYHVQGNSISIEHVYKWSDGRLHRNYEYGTIEKDRIILTHASSDGSRRRRPLPQYKIYLYDEALTAKPAWVH